MALTNPTKLISLQELQYFEGKLAAKYQTQAIEATGLSADTVVGALEELARSIAGLPSAIVPKGTKAFSGLTPDTDLAAANVGFMWNISDDFTTTSDFIEGAGVSIPAGANVYVANPSTGVYKYDIFQGMYDLSGYALKSEMAITDVSGDSTKKNIQLKSGLSQDVLVAHQDISGKADKDTDAVEGNLAEFDANGNPVDSGIAASTIGDKADKVSGATSGNFAGLDSNGNLTDSGSKASDFATAAQGAKADSAIQSVKVGGTALTPDTNKAVDIPVAANSDIDEIFA